MCIAAAPVQYVWAGNNWLWKDLSLTKNCIYILFLIIIRNNFIIIIIIIIDLY